MKSVKNILIAVSLLAGTILAGCNETLYVDPVNNNPPTIELFAPASGPIGSQITITGTSLNNVNEVKIGGVAVEIKYRISDTQLVAVAVKNGKSGKITVTSSRGTVESGDAFTYTYPAPALNLAKVPAVAEMGNNILLEGSGFDGVTSVNFTVTGKAAVQGEIQQQTPTEIIVKIPYVADDNVKLSLSYFNGTTNVETPAASNPAMVIIRHAPVVTTNVFPTTDVGKTIHLEGTYLTKLDSITVGGFKGIISNLSDTSLDLMIPAGNFNDGANPGLSIVTHYFSGNETRTLTTTFTAYVPMVKFWENVSITGQDYTANSSFTCFFSPETGIAYGNSEWKTAVDPTSYAKYSAGGSCSAANRPNVTASEYAASLPYFFISGANAGTLAINSPANSNGQLKNFRMTTTSSSYISAGNGNYYGTPVVMFRLLNPAVPVEQTIRQSVINQTITEINATNYPITATTIGGVDLSSSSTVRPSGAPNNTSWCPEAVLGNVYNNVDAIFMVIYYDVNGYVSTATTTNVEKIGFLHVKTLDFKLYTGTAPSASIMTFNMYWMKYAY